MVSISQQSSPCVILYSNEKKHDRYNLGQDWFVEHTLAGSHWKGHNIWWCVEVEWRMGLLEPSSRGAWL
jgi:hypothetical protein